MSSDEISEMVSSLQNQMVDLQKSRDELRLQLDEMSKVKSSYDPNDPEDPDDGSEPDDNPEPQPSEIPDNSFKVLTSFNDDEHLFKMVSGEQTIRELKFAISGRLDIPWLKMELTPFGGDGWLADETSIDEPLWNEDNEVDIDPFAPYQVGFYLEPQDDCILPEDGEVLVNIVQQFGDRKTFSLPMLEVCQDEALDCISAYLMEKTRIPLFYFRLSFRDDASELTWR